jgi:predicted DNA-binding transcriptional regulator YafY
MTTDALAWPAMALGMTGAEFEVREPPELVDMMRDWAARFARAASA